IARGSAASTRSASEAVTSVVHGDAEGAAVVVQEIVVDREKQPAAAPHPERTLVVADEERIAGFADPANARRRRTAGNRPPGAVRRGVLSFRAVLAPGPPSNFAARGKIQRLPRPHVDAGVGPTRRGVNREIVLPKARRPARSAVLTATIAASFVEFDTC